MWDRGGGVEDHGKDEGKGRRNRNEIEKKNDKKRV